MGPYADFVVQTDWTAGQVLQTLEEKNIKNNILVIFTSDNGSFMFRVGADQGYPFEESTPEKALKIGGGQQDHVASEEIQGYYPDSHQANYKWRGTKADIWEAGHRVPFIVCWPGSVKAGPTSEQTICVTDIMATVADIVAYPLDTGEGEDSNSLMTLLTGKAENFSRPPVIHHSVRGMFSIREGPWKMIFGNGSGGRQVPRGKPFSKPYMLFNMERDPMETTNVIDQYPDVAKRLTEKLDDIRGTDNQ